MRRMRQSRPVRAEFEKIVGRELQSFYWRHLVCRQFSAPYHYHPEFEIIHIRRGRGSRLVSSSIAHFGPNDLVFMAPNVPHVWQVAPDCPQAETVYVQFLPGFAGAEFFSLPEMQPVAKMMEAARSGLTFSAPVREEVAARLLRFPKLTPTERLLELLEIFLRLSRDPGMRPLGHAKDEYPLSRSHEERINHVFLYLNRNLNRPITQAEVAREARLSPAAFSRMFKRATGKRFMKVVNELRMAQVCRLLSETDRTIAEIAFECGYETLSHFNCQFRTAMKMTPRQYRGKLGAFRK